MSSPTISDISITNVNTDIPYFPSCAWGLTETDWGNPNLYTFNWLQAFWNTTSYTGDSPPVLVISNGVIRADGTYIVSEVPFAYSGERINIKGKILLGSGVDRRGITVTSTPINSGSPITSLLKVVAYGGNY